MMNGAHEPPLHIWFIDRSHANKEDGTINKGSAEPLVAKTMAAEILRLVLLGQQGKATIGDRALCPGDIAVLVRKNRQARLMQEELIKHSIPVFCMAQRVFLYRMKLRKWSASFLPFLNLAMKQNLKLRWRLICLVCLATMCMP